MPPCWKPVFPKPFQGNQQGHKGIHCIKPSDNGEISLIQYKN